MPYKPPKRLLNLGDIHQNLRRDRAIAIKNTQSSAAQLSRKYLRCWERRLRELEIIQRYLDNYERS